MTVTIDVITGVSWVFTTLVVMGAIMLVRYVLNIVGL